MWGVEVVAHSPFGSRFTKKTIPKRLPFFYNTNSFTLHTYLGARTVSKEVWLKMFWCFFNYIISKL